jgi:hypothetical protein
MIDPSKSSTNPNDNCLEGKRCPECGSYGPFEVAIFMRVLLFDSGTDDAEDGAIEFDDDSRTICYACRHEGKFSDFSE